MQNSTSNTAEKELESTIELVEKGMEKKETTGASTSISHWMKTLSGHKELKPIADHLEGLKEALSAKDGAKIVKMMETLGQETTKAASAAHGPEAEKIKKLGGLLSAGAKKIATLVKK